MLAFVCCTSDSLARIESESGARSCTGTCIATRCPRVTPVEEYRAPSRLRPRSGATKLSCGGCARHLYRITSASAIPYQTSVRIWIPCGIHVRSFDTTCKKCPEGWITTSIGSSACVNGNHNNVPIIIGVSIAAVLFMSFK